jgi:required for meiotic nuclear division protein 1
MPTREMPGREDPASSREQPAQERLDTFHAVAFVENFTIKELAAIFPDAKGTHHQLWYDVASGGTVFVYPFGVVVFHNVGQAGREGELLRMRRSLPSMASTPAINEQFAVREQPGSKPDIAGGVLVLDQLNFERAIVVALSVAQSAAMEYYERIVDQMFQDTDKVVHRLEKKGTMPIVTKRLYRFIGAAIGTRSEVLSVLHLLDKPDAAWDDPIADRIYEQLRAEFDLADRYSSLELKLRSVQEALELVADVARDRRLVMLEASIVILIVFEIALSLFDRFAK